MTKILQLTDFHLFANHEERLKGIDTRSSLAAVVQHVLDSEVSIDHIIVTGDHTHDELASSYAFAKSQLERLADHWWQVPGNHDDRPVLRSIFPNVSGSGDDPIRFHFESDSWACIGLDSHVAGSVSGRIEAEQIDWLKKKLNASRSEYVALFLHHPPLDISSEWMDQIGLIGRERLAEVVAVDHRIQLIVCGHVHHDFRSELHQATVVASPSTGIQFDPNGASPTFAADAPGYRVIELSPDGWKSEVVRVHSAAGILDVES
ncbi:MAG: metallophosphoesterase [Fuerstiella sp.]